MYTHLEVCNDYQNGLTQVQIAKKYKTSQTQIYRILKKHSIPIRQNGIAQRKYSLDEHYFDEIDTPEKAYILGTLYADGTFQPKNRSVFLALSTCDIDILEKINHLLQSNKPIKNYQYKDNLYSRLDICGAHVSSQIEKKGVVHRKTHNLSYPEWLAPELSRHFIRGYFDGDGSVYHNQAYTEIGIAIIGTNDLAKAIQNILFKELKICGHLKQHKNQSNSILEIGGNKQVIAVLDWLYKDATIYLDRKFYTYKKYKTSYQSRVFNSLEKRKIVQVSKEGDFIKIWHSQKELCNSLKLDSGAVSNCCSGRLKSTGGYYFKRLADYMKLSASKN